MLGLYSKTNIPSSHLIHNRITHSATVALMADDVQQLVRDVMAATGFNQSELAHHADVSQGTISKWLAGGHTPNKARWDRFVAWGSKNKKTAHLFATIDAKLAGYDADVKKGALAVLQAYLDNLPRR